MKIGDFYKKAIETGIRNDPRGEAAVREKLDSLKKDFDGMKDREKEFFDRESLVNPYSDTRILHGDTGAEFHSAMVGIDLEVGEIALADSLRSRGRKVDLLISHHPEGAALAYLYDVMGMQSEILRIGGVPVNVAETLMEARVKDVERSLMPVNHTRSVDAARLMGIPYMCMHTPADNMVAAYLQKRLDTEAPRKLGDIIDMLMEIPEYRSSAAYGAGPKILCGSKDRSAGRCFVDMTGGTEGSKEIFPSLVQGGVNTLVGMHLSEAHRKEAEKSRLNVIIAGHISSDNLGINLLLDEVMRQESFEVLDCSGFKRVSRL